MTGDAFAWRLTPAAILLTYLLTSPTATRGQGWTWPDGSAAGGNGNELRGRSIDFGRNQDPGILTGPVPSWQRKTPQRYEHCKCAIPFNCQSPGITFGTCDTGKAYCCYGDKNNRQTDSVRPNRRPSGFNRPSANNGILVGPGGPTGVIGRPQDNGNGILVGPGGPTGVIGRPQGSGYGNGILVGPGGPTGNIGRPQNQDNGVLVGPGGPTGIIGPPRRPIRDLSGPETQFDI